MPSGFTLLEFVGYLVLSVLLLTLAGSQGVAFYFSALKMTRTVDQALEMSVALHCLARDIRDSSMFTFKEKGERICVIRKNGMDIGWVFAKGLLFRCVGQYEKESNKWKSCSRSFLLTGLHRVKFTYHKKGITCNLESTAILLEQYIGVL